MPDECPFKSSNQYGKGRMEQGDSKHGIYAVSNRRDLAVAVLKVFASCSTQNHTAPIGCHVVGLARDSLGKLEI
jgi:hypothetical protein